MKNLLTGACIIFAICFAISAITQILEIIIYVLSFQNVAVSLLVIFGIIFTSLISKK